MNLVKYATAMNCKTIHKLSMMKETVINNFT